jgi:DNA-binding MarR family transcriptional regulator
MDEPAGADGLEADVAAVERALTRLTWIETKQFALQLERFGLTPAQYLALVQLVRVGRGCSMSELAERMHQSSATMTGIVDRLVRHGLAERTRDQSDRRLVLVGLTDVGRQLLAAAYEAKHGRTREILGTFSPAERRRMRVLLEAYLEAAEARLGR